MGAEAAAPGTALTVLLPGDAVPPPADPLWRRRASAPTALAAPAPVPYLREAALCALFGVATDAEADVPVAALGAAAELPEAGAGHWLRADPVLVMPARAELRLLDAAPALTAADAAKLVAAMADLIPGAAWHAPAPARCYVQLPAPAAIRTTPPHALVGHNLEDALPRGPDGARWCAWLNEAQMRLHAAAGEEAEAMRASSVWFWGAGATPAVSARRFDVVFADDPVARGLGLLAGCAVRGAAAGAPGATPGRVLLVPSAAAPDWAPAVRQMLDRGAAGSCTVVWVADASVWTCRLSPRRAWWQRWARR